MRLQSSIGKVNYTGRDDMDNTGKLSIGKVIRVYEKENTVDVVLISGSFHGDNRVTDGEITGITKIEPFSGWDDELQVAYGDITPIEVGQRVIIGYIDSMKEKPVVLGSLPQINNNPATNNPIHNTGGEIKRERGERVKVNKLQDYSYMNGRGEFEKVSNSRSFFVGRHEKMSDHREDPFDWEDLTLKNKYTGKTIGLPKDKYPFKPFNYLVESKNTYDEEEDTVYTRVYHDAENQVTRLVKDKQDRLFMIELDDEDNFKVRMQPTSYKRKKLKCEPKEYEHKTLRQSDLETYTKYRMLNPKEIEVPPKIKDLTSIEIKNDGTIELIQQDKKDATRITISEGQIDINSTKSMNLNSNQTITLRANKSIELLAPHVYTWDKDTPYVDKPLSYEDVAERDKEGTNK